MTWNCWLNGFIRHLAARGISSSILYTCSPYAQYKRGISYQELADYAKKLFDDESLTPDERIKRFYTYRNT